jgi:hypothetical protein
VLRHPTPDDPEQHRTDDEASIEIVSRQTEEPVDRG